MLKKLRNLGVSQEVAEVQAQELEHVIDIAVNTSKEEFQAKELANKGDIREVKSEIRETELRLQKEIEIVRKEIVQAKNQTLIWTFGMFAGFAAFLLGAMAKGFHWW
jgi:hypothetical protein